MASVALVFHFFADREWREARNRLWVMGYVKRFSMRALSVFFSCTVFKMLSLFLELLKFSFLLDSDHL